MFGCWLYTCNLSQKKTVYIVYIIKVDRNKVLQLIQYLKANNNFKYIINRPGVAGAVLQKPLSFIK